MNGDIERDAIAFVRFRKCVCVDAIRTMGIFGDLNFDRKTYLFQVSRMSPLDASNGIEGTQSRDGENTMNQSFLVEIKKRPRALIMFLS